MSKSGGVPRKVLIVLLGAIGDVTRGLPLAVRLKREWPETELWWAVEPISRLLVENHPAIDRVVVFDRPRGFPAYLHFIRELRRERFDLVLDMQRHLKSGVTSFATGASRRIGFSYKNSREGNWLFNTEHVEPMEHRFSKAVQFQKFGDALGLAPLEPLEFALSASSEELEESEEMLKRVACSSRVQLPGASGRAAFILGSTWESRFWLAEYYAELADSLFREKGIVSILVGGRREREFAEQVSALAKTSVLNLVEQTSLRGLVPLFSSVSFAVGSDSGPMHIAAAVGCPVISLWGSTSPLRSAPVGSEEYVLEAQVECSPCYKRRCPGLGMVCMKGITPSDVLAQVDRVLAVKSREKSAIC